MSGGFRGMFVLLGPYCLHGRDLIQLGMIFGDLGLEWNPDGRALKAIYA